jgi:F-type H+-transporting ATPase subunit delta
MMSELVTLARPYARAAYDFAKAHNACDKWLTMLSAIDAVVADDLMQKVLSSSEVGIASLEKIFIKILGERLDSFAYNFLKQLIASKRLTLMPQILTLFEKINDQAQGRVDVVVATAIEIDSAQQQALTKKISEKLNHEIQSRFEVDPEIIAGAIIRIGDSDVLDGSVKTQIQRLQDKFNSSDKR